MLRRRAARLWARLWASVCGCRRNPVRTSEPARPGAIVPALRSRLRRGQDCAEVKTTASRFIRRALQLYNWRLCDEGREMHRLLPRVYTKIIFALWRNFLLFFRCNLLFAEIFF